MSPFDPELTSRAKAAQALWDVLDAAALEGYSLLVGAGGRSSTERPGSARAPTSGQEVTMPIYAVFSPRFVGGVTVAGTGVRSQLEAIAFPGSVPAGTGPAYLPSRFILVEMQPHAVPPALRQRGSPGVHGHDGVRWDFTKNSDFRLPDGTQAHDGVRWDFTKNSDFRLPDGTQAHDGVRWDFTKNSDFTVNISRPKDPAGVTVHGVVVERDPGIVRLSPGTHPVERFVLRYLRMTRAGMAPTAPDVTVMMLTELGAEAQRLAPSQSAGGRMPAHGGMMILLQDGNVHYETLPINFAKIEQKYQRP